MPCYRYGHFLKECVESVLTQTGPCARVLIIDDASPDNTAEVATELARSTPPITFVRHNVNQGHIATYNEGIEWTSSDYLLLLSADDYLLPGALQRAVALMDRHPAVAFAFGNAIELYPNGSTRATKCFGCRNSERVLSGMEFITLSGAKNIVPTPTAVVRTQIQKKVGGYRADLPHSGDMEMWLRLAVHADVGFIGAPQAVYRRHSANMSHFYTAQGCLPDIQQRKAALDSFFEHHSSAMHNPDRLRKKLDYLLACDAISSASTVFNDGELEVATRLSSFAVQISPRIKNSWVWAKLLCKRGMGLKTWLALQRGARRLRQTAFHRSLNRLLVSRQTRNVNTLCRSESNHDTSMM